MENTNVSEKRITALATIGLILNLVFILICLPTFNFLVLILLLYPFVGIIPFLLPVVSITLGICGIVNHLEKNREQKKIGCLILNIVNVLLPIVVAVVLITLFSTGVLVIRFM